MMIAGEEPSCTAEQVIDLISTVRELHGLSSQELNKLLKDSENFTIHLHAEKGSILKIDVEKLAGILPLHLIAVLMSSDRDESFFKYLLSGIRLLHSLCDLAPRHSKLEQVLFDDVKVSEQLLDMVFYLLIVLGSCGQDSHGSRSVPLVHSALVACSLHLLTACISSQWQDLVQVLVAHPKVDIFMDSAFGAVLVAISFLQVKLSALDDDFNVRTCPMEKRVVNYLCQQCEASLQFLLSLCKQKVFRERLLRNKELCGKGGVLFLAQAILKLNVSTLFVESPSVVAAVSRLKAKVLSVLLHLCEAESISYLDEVASSPQSFDLAKSVVLEVLELLTAALYNDTGASGASSDRPLPMGLLQLNAMRLADIFSDDSNFRSYITTCFTKVLTAIFSLPPQDFLPLWCSSEVLPREEDASLEYDAFTAAGWVLDTFSAFGLPDTGELEISLIPSNMPQAAYSHQRTSLFVKVIANLHCFVPNICEEQERNLFLHKFLECMRMDPSKSLPEFSFPSGALKAVTIGKNLRSLLSHAESLIPNFLNEDDVQLLRVFFNQLQALASRSDFVEIQDVNFDGSIYLDKFSKLDTNEQHQEAQSTGRYPSPLPRKEPSDHKNGGSNHKEEMLDNVAFQDEDHLKCMNDPMDQGDNVMEIKDEYGGSASGALIDVDREVQNVEASVPDTSSTRGGSFGEQVMNGDIVKSSEDIKESGSLGVHGDEKPETVQFEEKQPRKRKRTIMNDNQMLLIENALLDEPDMHRHAASLQSWADKLSLYGPEVTSSQLKNWLNNRKARLARAGKDARAAPEIDRAFADKQVGSIMRRRSQESPESIGEDNIPPSAGVVESRTRIGTSEVAEVALASESAQPGQSVLLVGGEGEEIGRGKVYQVQGKWYGKSLEELEACVVDVTELKVESYTRLPYPSGGTTGSSFSEAETRIGVMRVLWNPNNLHILRHPNSLEERDLNS